MPFLRFTRDTRGYENTYVMHSFRRRGSVRPRILYWFRTPPSVKVGRAPLDEEAIRSIEKSNPELSFDWTRILETQPEPSNGVDAGRARRRRRDRPTPSARQRAARDLRPSERSPEPAPGGAPREAPPFAPAEAVLSAAGFAFDTTAPAAAAVGDAGVSPESAELVDADGEAVALAPWEEPPELPIAPPASAAVEALVGAEGLARLRARFAEIQARITERAGDPARAEELRKRAERLDPDTWVTDEEARAGLETFEARFEELRLALGRRRRRSRRGGARHRRRSGGEGGAPKAPAPPIDNERGS